MSIPIHDTVLNTGAKMPVLGLGCWMSKPVEGKHNETYEMVANALKCGYRHIDTAYGYGNEEAVGMAIRDSGVPRKDIFVTTKLTNSDHGRVSEAFERSFKALDIDYIDLYLMHWPMGTDPETKKTIPFGESPNFSETYTAMENLLADGRCKQIGVSNFSVKNLEILLPEVKVVPAVNQVECHLYLPQMGLSKYCQEKGIILTAYSPLGQPKPGQKSPVLTDPLVKKLAEKYGRPEGTILLSWIAQRPGWNVVPKSANPERMKANLDIVRLDDEDHLALSRVHTDDGKLQHLCDYSSGDIMKNKELFGWSLEDLGWERMD